MSRPEEIIEIAHSGIDSDETADAFLAEFGMKTDELIEVSKLAVGGTSSLLDHPAEAGFCTGFVSGLKYARSLARNGELE